MRKYVLWFFIVLFVALNVLAIYLRHPDQASSRQVMHGNPDASPKAQAASLSKAEGMIAEWNRGALADLKSATLAAEVSAIPEGSCLELTAGAERIPPSEIATGIREEFHFALAGLLRAFANSDPDSVIKYMNGQGKTLSPMLRTTFERSLRRLGEKDLSPLSLDELYVKTWNTLKYSPHWQGLVVSSSCIAYFDGRSIPYSNLITISTDYETNSASTAAQLADLTKTIFVFGHSFVPKAGDLKAELANASRVIVAEILLVLGLDEAKFQVKKPYIVRFWYNSTEKKWQPIALIGFGTHPENSTAEAFSF